MINDQECDKAGVDAKKIKAIERALKKAVKQANALGVTVFGGTGTLSLRFTDDPAKGDLILAEIKGNVSGGCGAQGDEDGFIRGEI